MKKHRREEQGSFDDIDKDRLDEEWVKQPKLYRNFADRLAKAEDKLTRLQNNLKLVEALVARKARNKPSKYGISKATEAAVKEAVLLSADYRDALNDIADAKFEVDLLKSAVRALEHRKRALEKLVELRLADYYAEPSAQRSISSSLSSKAVRKGLRRDREDDDDSD